MKPPNKYTILRIYQEHNSRSVYLSPNARWYVFHIFEIAKPVRKFLREYLEFFSILIISNILIRRELSKMVTATWQHLCLPQLDFTLKRFQMAVQTIIELSLFLKFRIKIIEIACKIHKKDWVTYPFCITQFWNWLFFYFHEVYYFLQKLVKPFQHFLSA